MNDTQKRRGSRKERKRERERKNTDITQKMLIDPGLKCVVSHSFGMHG